MKDFFGQQLEVGDWVVKGGGGNRDCEYGMILHLVTKVTDKSISTERLSISYNPKKVKLIKTNIRNGNKCVLVEPPPGIPELFERARTNTSPQLEINFCAKWVHGKL